MVVTASQIATGLPLEKAQYDFESGIKYLLNLKKNGAVVYNDAPQALQMMQSGQVPLVPFYVAFAAALVAKGAPIAPAVHLKEGKHGEIVGLNMPVNAQNVELAQVYVNLSLEKDFQSKIDSVLRARCGHLEVQTSPDTLKLIGDPANTTYADWAFLSKNRAKITELWNEIFG
jgi:putative spermidine/putrescine transport system substrate-binding protein